MCIVDCDVKIVQWFEMDEYPEWIRTITFAVATVSFAVIIFTWTIQAVSNCIQVNNW